MVFNCDYSHINYWLLNISFGSFLAVTRLALITLHWKEKIFYPLMTWNCCLLSLQLLVT